jgi:hypothetical protein
LQKGKKRPLLPLPHLIERQQTDLK